MESKKGQHQFSDEERSEALEEIAEHGVPATVRKLRISKTTLYKWRAQQRAVVADDAVSEGDDEDVPIAVAEKPFETDVHTRIQAAFLEHGIGPPAVLHRAIGSATTSPVAPKGALAAT